MTNNISTLVVNQISENKRDIAPLFSEFIETYYNYTQLIGKPTDLIQNHSDIVDVDLTNYIDKFYITYAKDLPLELALDKNNFIKLLNQIYTAKGTENAYKLLFRALFNTNVTLTTPSDQILKASDGVWFRESFFTVNTLFGSVFDTANVIEFNNQYGQYTIESTRFEYTSPTTVRFYYNAITEIKLGAYQAFFIKDSIGVQNIFVGQLVNSPNKLRIQTPGTNWQVGQVVIIPGSVKDTIARITAVNSIGGVIGIEILEYGYNHTPNQTTYISPFPNKPVGSIVNTTSTLIPINPDVYNHIINISDYTDGTTEDIIGTSDSVSLNSYFLQDYVEPGYIGSTVFTQQSNSGELLTPTISSEITIEDWIQSRAVFVFEQADIVKTKGKYRTETGHISNQSIRIQDNYFYQLFSYVIDSTRDISEYKTPIKKIHPAGLKLFSTISKEFDSSLDPTVSRTKSFDTSYLLDILVPSTDDNYLEFIKQNVDQVQVLDSLDKQSIKYLYDTATVTHSEFSTLTVLAYSDDYFAENYSSLDNQLVIG